MKQNQVEHAFYEYNILKLISGINNNKNNMNDINGNNNSNIKNSHKKCFFFFNSTFLSRLEIYIF